MTSRNIELDAYVIKPLFTSDSSTPWIEFIQASSLWHSASEELIPMMQSILNQARQYFQYDPARIQLCVLLTDDAQSHALNKQYRKKDAPTNVLSFPQEDLKKGTYLPKDETVLLGDIVLAYECIQKECALTQKSLKNHVSHLVLHGFLHLLGFDHKEEDDANEMEQLEIKLLKTSNIRNPYDTLHPDGAQTPL